MDYQKVIMSLLGDNKFETAKTVIDYLDQIHTKKEKISEIEKGIEDIQKKIDSLLSTKSDDQSIDIPKSPEPDISNSNLICLQGNFQEPMLAIPIFKKQSYERMVINLALVIYYNHS